jgi:hypothetical protein
VKKRPSLPLAAAALTMSLSALTFPWPVAGVSSDCSVDAPSSDVYAIAAPAYVWDGRLAGSYAAADVCDGPLPGSDVGPAYTWDGRLAG